MTQSLSATPVDPARHRALAAAIYASLPAHLKHDALELFSDWPRLIHSHARAGELAAPPAPVSADR